MDAPKARIWELDAFRGIAILAVILIHLLFDLRYFLGLSLGYDNTVFQFVKQYGGVVFVVLSGICVTLGRRSFRRGLIVFGCAMAVTLVTLAMVWLGLDSGSVVVRFGVLHLLGIAMLLWPLLRRLPTWAMVAIGLPVVGLGYWFQTFHVSPGWLFPLGLTSAGFSSSDYFPSVSPFWAGSCWGRRWAARPTGKSVRCCPGSTPSANPSGFSAGAGGCLFSYIFPPAAALRPGNDSGGSALTRSRLFHQDRSGAEHYNYVTIYPCRCASNRTVVPWQYHFLRREPRPCDGCLPHFCFWAACCLL